jgi:hypothetical protein
MNISKTSIFHPFLFAIFPIIHLYSINLIEVPINDIIFPMFVSVLVTGSLLLLSRVILKDWIKSSLIVSLLLVLSFSYGHIYYLLNGLTLEDFEILRHRYLMVVFLVIFIIGTIAIVKTQIRLDNLTKIITGIAITLILITIPSFVYAGITTSEINDDTQVQIVDDTQVQNPRITYELKNITKLNSIEKPDVYYIILDGYGGTKRMKQDLNFDNYEFLSELTNRGFFAPDLSSGNYPSTNWQMTSIFSMNYLPSKEKEQSDQEYYSSIIRIKRSNEVMRNFHHLDYEIINFQTKGSITQEFLLNDQTFCQREQLKQSKFTQMLLRTTIISYFNNQIVVNTYRESILCGFSEISNLTEKNDKPIFVFMHLAIPHPPYVFGPNGEYVFGGKVQTEEGSFVDEEKYVDSIKFVNKKILEVTENILRNNENSIIIIQSDHGYDFGINYENPSDLSLKQRFSILNAIYLPNGDEDVFYEGITSVNTFRIIFNEYFGTSYEILEDRMYYHPYGVTGIYTDVKFQDVTEIIVN